MSTALVSVTSIDPAAAEGLLDDLAELFPVSASRTADDLWIVEVEQPDPGDPQTAVRQIGRTLASLEPAWAEIVQLGAVWRG